MAIKAVKSAQAPGHGGHRYVEYMEIYTPVHMDCMCYVSGCNLHGGYNRMLSMVHLQRGFSGLQMN